MGIKMFDTSNKKIAVIGGDRRFYHLAEELRHDGFSVGVPENGDGEALDAALSGACAAVLPFPVSPDGVYLNAPGGADIRLIYLFEKIKEHKIDRVFGGAVSPAVQKAADAHGIAICDYGKMETVALKNALCTAEGAIEIALRELPVTLHSASVTVLGYGRIGRILSVRLASLGASVKGVARKSEDLAKMQIDGVKPYYFKELNEALCGAELIYNTVPSSVIGKEALARLEEKPLIVDLASAPGGIDRDAALALGINVIWALSLPGKTAPKTAALIIKEAVLGELLR